MIKLIFLQICSILLLCSSYANSPKVDNSGRFKPFPGVTVVSSVGEAQKEMWEKIHTELSKNPLILEHYALMPPSSYHMTAFSLFNILSINEVGWSSFVSKNLPWFQKLSQYLSNDFIQPNVTPIEVSVSDTIAFVLYLEKDQIRKIRAAANKFGVPRMVPNYFHVTLGYLYKTPSLEVRTRIQEEIEPRLMDIVKTYGSSLTFEDAKLSYFRDMTAFIPWNGESNPFSECRTKKTNWLFSCFHFSSN